ncbi:hypothetical protein ACO0LF_25080 [Undibacterium sp. Di27W]|uniref:hypothetical protein n=1 Tax=Undibacterium sp. Di27W TaxID=3413036 RepID=UPI003BF2A39D
MTKQISETRNVNIRHDLPKEIMNKLPDLYKRMEGWLGFGDGTNGMNGIPYWYSFDEEQAFISASIEPSGLQFLVNNIDEEKWNLWLLRFKKEATEILGFKVGETELGEVSSTIEWITL